MTSQRGTTIACRSAAVLRAAVGACVISLAAVALAQDSPSPGEPSDNVTAAAPLESERARPGLFEVFGRWMEQGATRLKSDMQGVQDRFDKLGKKAHEAAKDATGAVAGLPNARVVTARERCPAAQNGAPDCQTAANALCREKGFKGGKSLDTQSEQKCPARVLLERRTANASDCPTEIFVTRAMCQ